jgi:hypothetical protein
MIDAPRIYASELKAMSPEELRSLASKLLERIDTDAKEIHWRDAKIEKLTFEMAQLRRVRFGVKSDQLDAGQKRLFEEAIDEDLAAMEAELRKLRKPAPPTDKEPPKRKPLPDNLPRHEIRHEPDNTACQCGCQMKRIGEDVSEKLDYVPGTFSVERHIRGKWVCTDCKTLVQAPVRPK